MRRMCVMGVVVVVALLAVATVFAGPYPDQVVDRIMAMKNDAEAKKDMPPSLEGLPIVKGDEANKLWKKKAIFLDNRIKPQVDAEKIEGATWLFADDLLKDPALAAKLDKSKDYVVYCNGVQCWRSPATGMMLKQLGFQKVYWYRDGIPDWKQRGYPVE